MALNLLHDVVVGTLHGAKRTAWHLRESEVIGIMTHTLPMKTNAHVSRSQLTNWHLFLCIRSSDAKKYTVVGHHDHDLNTDRKRRFLNFRKGTEVVKERFDLVCFQRLIKMAISIMYKRRSDLSYGTNFC